MNNIILKTALKTFLALFIALFVAFGIASLGFPQHMATACENIGAYSFATGYASLRYSYSGDKEDLARCLEDSILAGKDRNIVVFGNRLTEDRQAFDEYCKTKTEGVWKKYDYRQYVLGALACAKFASGEADGAIDTAKYALEGAAGFPVPNAAGDLAEDIKAAGDAQTAGKLYDAVAACVAADSAEESYLAAVRNILSAVK